MNAIGVDLGGTNIKAALVSEEGKFLRKKNVKTEVASGKEKIAAKIVAIVEELAEEDRSVSVGIGSPGSIDRKNGLVRFSPNLPDWLDFPLARLVSERSGREVFIENDAKAAALGEKWFGEARGCESFVVLTLGTGVGGGAVTNGQLLIGGGGIGGELGHMCVDPSGPLCGCGSHGCLECYASSSGMRKLVEEYRMRYPNSLIFREQSGGQFEAVTVFSAYQKGDPLAEIIYGKFVFAMGVAIGSLVNIFNPEKIILSGGISSSASLYLEKVKKIANEHTILSMMNSFEIVQSSLKENAAIYGAASIVFDRKQPHTSEVQ
ncbi:MAG TPA: ROK family protein [Thermotogota bacterium]|nr:ROK family protein [Thermotogota bacterium]